MNSVNRFSVLIRIGVLAAIVDTHGCVSTAPNRDGFEAAADVAADVETDHLMPWIETLANEHLSDPKLPCDGFETDDMYPACELSHDSARVFIEARLSDFGYQPERLVLPGAPLPATNIIAERRGAEQPNKVVLLCAHYDAFFSGADDNSSGVAVMLEVARVLAHRQVRKTVRFIGLDLEEYGLIGSHRYVEAGHADDVEIAVVLETIGYASTEKGSQDAVLGLPMGERADVGDFLAAVGNEQTQGVLGRLTALNNEHGFVKLKTLLGADDGVLPVTGQLMRSDHGAFWLKHKRAFMFTDSANFRNPHYHQKTDTPDTLNETFLGAAARLVAATVALLAGVIS